jgi:glycosyltransferase involved in cell wall biosynthesis
VVSYSRQNWATLELHAKTAQVIILNSDGAADFPQIAALDAKIVIDGYDPLIAEWLALRGQDEAAFAARLAQLEPQFALGDFFICASERQRDWWLGLLEAHGRVNPRTFAADPTLRNLVDVVPYGVREDAPKHAKPILKGVWPGIDPDSKVILWGGGLWTWLDPQTAVRAIAKIAKTRDDVRLVFPGTRHPNPDVAGIPTHTQAVMDLAQGLGLLNTRVFFGDWIPYEDWPAVLMESDLALSLHHDSYETRLAFRSRMLEYIWAGLPIVCTTGDATADLVAKYGLGEVVAVGDVDAVARGIEKFLDVGLLAEVRHLASKARADFAWLRCAEPLIRFCQNPRRAADHLPSRPERAQAGEDIAQIKKERDELRALVRGYESGKFISFMRWIKSKGDHAG